MKTQNFNSKQLAFILFIVCFNWFPGTFAAAIHPNILLNSDEINAIKSKFTVSTNGDVIGEEPWRSAYILMISQANSALNINTDINNPTRGMSVTYGGLNRCGANNIFCTEGFYDGSDRYDWEQGAKPLGIAVRDLGMAYAFTNNPIYADKLIELVKIWAIDSATAMQPKFGNNQGRMDLYGTMTGLIYGVDLTWNYSGWTQSDKDTFKTWVYDLADRANNFSPGTQNFENWRNAFVSIAGAFVGDDRLLNDSFQKYKNAIPNQVHWTGRMTQESGRVNGWGGLGYSMYAIHAMIQTAEVARHHGIDLYNYTSDGVRGLRVALDFHVPYVKNPSSWQWGVNPDGTTINGNSGIGLYELAYSIWQDPEHFSVINHWGRPMKMNMWALGIVTLTHANQFDLDLTPQPPSIITQPESITVIEGESANFNVTATGASSLTYQWFSGGDIINGAINNTYTLEQAIASDNGKVYHCEVSNDLGTAISTAATLSVNLDNISPVIDTAIVQNPVQVEIIFSEAVTQISAQNVDNYHISGGIQVISANLNSDGKTVQLQTDNLTTEVTYTLTINNIQDTSSAANVILPDSTIDIQFAPIMTFDNGQLPFGWIPLTLSRWSVVEDNNNNALFLNTSNYNPLSGNRLGEHILTPDSYGDFTLIVEARTNEPSGNANADYALIFGLENEENYYYMLFNRTQSNTQLFKVSSTNRQELATATSSWLLDEQYHTIQLSHILGEIEVRFDNNIVFQYTDTSVADGKIGLGSFNDSAYFDDIRITSAASTVDDMIFSNAFE